MNMSQNFHPHGLWCAMTATLLCQGVGACIQITLSDENGYANLAIHYGAEENREGFVKMFKEAVAKLP